jgi:hypothetical protein
MLEPRSLVSGFPLEQTSCTALPAPEYEHLQPMTYLARGDAPGKPPANSTQLMSSGDTVGFTPTELNLEILFRWASQPIRGASPAVIKTICVLFFFPV